jgi:hypothetical protein
MMKEIIHCEGMLIVCNIKRIDDKKHFQIRSQFQNMCYNLDVPSILTHQNYGDLETSFLRT